MTLYHGDLPQVLEDAGGWPERETALRVQDYAARVHDALGDRIHYWTTLREPFWSRLFGYEARSHAPGGEEQAQAVGSILHLPTQDRRAATSIEDAGFG